MEHTTSLDTLTRSWSKFCLTEEEQEDVPGETSDLEEVDTGGRPSVIGKYYTTRHYQKSALIAQMKSLWIGEGWVRFREIVDGVFLIQFEKEEDKTKVLQAGPWLFSRSLFLVKDVAGIISQGDYQFHSVRFWVHLIGLPLLGYTENMGRKVGAKIGSVLEVEGNKRMVWKGGLPGVPYLRLRVEFDVRKALPRGTYLMQNNSQRYWVFFRYERLPNFCYKCGKIGHTMQECMESSREGIDLELQYGDWLRASSDAKLPFSYGLGGGPERQERRQEATGNDSQKRSSADTDTKESEISGIIPINEPPADVTRNQGMPEVNAQSVPHTEPFNTGQIPRDWVSVNFMCDANLVRSLVEGTRVQTLSKVLDQSEPIMEVRDPPVIQTQNSAEVTSHAIPMETMQTMQTQCIDKIGDQHSHAQEVEPTLASLRLPKQRKFRKLVHSGRNVSTTGKEVGGKRKEQEGVEGRVNSGNKALEVWSQDPFTGSRKRLKIGDSFVETGSDNSDCQMVHQILSAEGGEELHSRRSQ